MVHLSENMSLIELDRPFKQFRHPSLSLICGPSGSGKTTFVTHVLQQIENMFDVVPQKIYFVYSEWQSGYDALPDIVEFHESLDKSLYDKLDPSVPSLLIADDYQHQAAGNELLSKLATQSCHHRSCSVMVILQNFYFGSGVTNLNIRRSAQYIIIMKSPQDVRQINTLATQMFPTRAKKLIDIYHDATEHTDFGYLLIDCRPDTPYQLRIRSKIFDQFPIIYKI